MGQLQAGEVTPGWPSARAILEEAGATLAIVHAAIATACSILSRFVAAIVVHLDG